VSSRIDNSPLLKRVRPQFRQGASTVGDQSAALGGDAARLGAVAMKRIADETGRRPLFALSVAIGLGILIGMAVRNSSR
jgi:hypothetical protein